MTTTTTTSEVKHADSRRKVPRDMTKARLTDAGLSIVAALFMLFLSGMVLGYYLAMVDKSPDGEFLQFKISLVSVDSSDVLRMNWLNRKFLIHSNLRPTSAEFRSVLVNKQIQHVDGSNEEHEEGSLSLNARNFDNFTHQYDIVLVKFFAPWCYWSKQLKPSWEEAAKIIREKYDPKAEGYISFAEVDCVAEGDLCRRNEIQGYPTIRIFRNGSDHRHVPNERDENKDKFGYSVHDSYYGNRDTDSLVEFAGSLVRSVLVAKQSNEEREEESISLNARNFGNVTHQYDILLVKFFAPWCYWSKRLKPSWEEAAKIIREKYDPKTEGRISLAEVDCTAEGDLCRRNTIRGYPTIRIFRKGINFRHAPHERDEYGSVHDSYYGDRDTDSIVKFAESLVRGESVSSS